MRQINQFYFAKFDSKGVPSPRTELLHNIDPLAGKRGELFNISDFDNRVSAAIRVDNWKLITGNPGTIWEWKYLLLSFEFS